MFPPTPKYFQLRTSMLRWNSNRANIHGTILLHHPYTLCHFFCHVLAMLVHRMLQLYCSKHIMV